MTKFVQRGQAAIFAILLLGACSDSPPPETVMPAQAPLTQEEIALEALTADKASALVMSVSPENKYGCRTLSVEVSRKDKSDGYWVPVQELSAVYDISDPAKRTAIDRQLLFAPLEKPGLYGITRVTCVPMEGETLMWRRPVGTFEVEYGKLNYAGTLSQHKISKAVYVYKVEDRSRDIHSRLASGTSGLSEYFKPNIMIPEKVINHDGAMVSIDDVIANKNQAGDFYSLYGMLRQKRDYIQDESFEMQRTVSQKRWKSIDDALQQTSYYVILADLYQETLYKFEDLVLRERNFRALEEYFLLRIRHDRATAFWASCSRKKVLDNQNDPCLAARSTFGMTNGEMQDFIQNGRINAGDSKEEAELKKRRLALSEKLAQESDAVLNHVFGMPKFPRFKDIQSTVDLSAKKTAAWAALRRFDAERAANRYGLSPSDKAAYMEYIDTLISAQADFDSVLARRAGNPDFDDMDVFRDNKAHLQRVENFIASLESEFF